MSIGILTYHRSENYGAVLQALALNRALRGMGFNTVFVDYQHPNHKELYALFSWNRFNRLSVIQKFKYLLVFLLTYSKKLKRKQNFQDFFNQHFDKDNLGSVYDRYDTVIYGSDQIWRKQDIIGIDGFLPIYFGSDEIASRNKITYAASMGEIRVDKNDFEFLKSSFSNFKTISVREADLKELVAEISGISPVHVVDPIFLLDKEEWERLAKPRLMCKKYILFYHLGVSQEATETVEKLRGETGYDVVELNGRIVTIASKAQRWNVVGPAEFLSLLVHAELVVTSSFHGVCFSLLFNKNFLAFPTKNPMRIESVLKDFGLESRIVKTLKAVDLNEPIKWEFVNKELQRKKEFSIGYLVNELR